MTMRVQREAKREQRQGESEELKEKCWVVEVCDSLSNTFACQRDNIISFIMEHGTGLISTISLWKSFASISVIL
jgi:hypothetical protein